MVNNLNKRNKIMTHGLPIMIDLPENFLAPEVRCGYNVPMKLKKIWAVELDLLAKLDEICKKYGLRYQVCYGTMIGAIRHKGFIPWDDDMDVWLPREDYDKLCEVAPKELTNPYFLQTALSDRRFFNPFARLRNSETTAVVTELNSVDYNNGIFIDVYPLDRAAPTHFKDVIQIEAQRFALRCATLHCQDKKRTGSWRRRLSHLIRPIVRCVSYVQWVKMYENAIRKYSGLRTDYAPLFSLCPHERAQRLSDSDVTESIYVDYEFMKVPVPRNYDELLRCYYGDYMTFPPEQERGKWHEGQIIFDPDVSYKKFMNTEIA